MKTLTKTLHTTNNISLLQFETLERDGFPFKPAGPAIEKEGLIIKEFMESGVVSKLLAINTTSDFLLLTDMDILKGAKQNRVVNTSVLIAPNSKSELDVSCVERFRWTYTSPSFKMSTNAMDFNLRSAKASTISSRLAGMIEEAEAFYKLDEFLDLVDKDLMPSGEQVAGLGKIRRIKNEKIPGFELSYDGQIIHLAAFAKNQE